MKNPGFTRVAEDMTKSDCCQEDIHVVNSGEKAQVCNDLQWHRGWQYEHFALQTVPWKSWSKAQSMSSNRHNHPLLQLPSITTCVYTIKYRTGKAIQEIYSQRTSDGKWQMGYYFQWPQTKMQPLQVIHCNCKASCQTSKCSCKKHGLQCSAACGQCKGTSCVNLPNPESFPKCIGASKQVFSVTG